MNWLTEVINLRYKLSEGEGGVAIEDIMNELSKI